MIKNAWVAFVNSFQCSTVTQLTSHEAADCCSSEKPSSISGHPKGRSNVIVSLDLAACLSPPEHSDIFQNKTGKIGSHNRCHCVFLRMKLRCQDFRAVIKSAHWDHVQYVTINKGTTVLKNIYTHLCWKKTIMKPVWMPSLSLRASPTYYHNCAIDYT